MKFLCKSSQLNLQQVLFGGQSFRWNRSLPSICGREFYYACMDNRWIVKLEAIGDSVHFDLIHPAGDTSAVTTNELKAHLETYFNLHVDLDTLYKSWMEDKSFAKAIGTRDLKAIRIMQLDPTENLFSFIISQNNHITRITSLVASLCSNYGLFMTRLDDQHSDMFSFPTAEIISQIKESELRELGFGYRAKYLVKAAGQLVQLAKDGKFSTVSEYLISLRAEPYSVCRSALLSLTGVGPKVADCICLFSLGKHEIIPVDTHVRQIATRMYQFKTRNKSMTSDDYTKIQEIFTSRFGPYAGWAHSVLFIADLKKNQLSAKVEESNGDIAIDSNENLNQNGKRALHYPKEK